jgi:hypothetical protein
MGKKADEARDLLYGIETRYEDGVATKDDKQVLVCLGSDGDQVRLGLRVIRAGTYVGIRRRSSDRTK